MPEISAGDVRARRQSLSLTQKAFAAVMGVSNKTVEAWENDTNTPAGTARRMMSMLQCDSSLLERFRIVQHAAE